MLDLQLSIISGMVGIAILAVGLAFALAIGAGVVSGRKRRETRSGGLFFKVAIPTTLSMTAFLWAVQWYGWVKYYQGARAKFGANTVVTQRGDFDEFTSQGIFFRSSYRMRSPEARPEHLIAVGLVVGVLSGGIALLLRRLVTKRVTPGHCWKCGYNLTGAPHHRCPECGEMLRPIAHPLSLASPVPDAHRG